MAMAAVGMMLTLNPNHTSTASATVQPSPQQIAHTTAVSEVVAEIGPKMKKSDSGEVKRVAEAIVGECEKTGFDPLFVLAIIESESSFDPEAVSFRVDRDGVIRANARGLMQIVPSTFRAVSDSKKMMDPVENVRAGIRYLALLKGHGFKRPETVLLAYNQGPKAAMAVYRDKEPWPDEGARFVPKVMAKYRQLLKKSGKDPKQTHKLFFTPTVDQKIGLAKV